MDDYLAEKHQPMAHQIHNNYRFCKGKYAAWMNVRILYYKIVVDIFRESSSTFHLKGNKHGRQIEEISISDECNADKESMKNITEACLCFSL